MDPLSSPTDPGIERAFLIGVCASAHPEWKAQDSLDELEELADTAGVEAVERAVVRLRAIHPATYVGRGKVEELAERIRACGAQVALFDEDLSPVQGRNLETLLGVRLVDRTQVILDIFARRAQTSEGRLQIELAQLEYLRPRLRHMWSHLGRQKGGIGLRGPGEQQLELDRRRIDQRLVRIRRELDQVRARREELRRGRRRHGWALVCLVGYTNAGKSTLLNALTGSGVYADDRLFATLDPTTRRLDLPNHQPALLTDTVGFIRKLPHGLVDAFRATLEEAVTADLLVHVLDVSHPAAEEHAAAVQEVIAGLGAGDRPMLIALNKCDRPEAAAAARRWTAGRPEVLAISARSGAGLEELRVAIADRLRDRSVAFRVRIPFGDGRSLSMLRQGARVESETADEEGWRVTGRAAPRVLGSLGPEVKHESDDE
jgi:GTPase